MDDATRDRLVRVGGGVAYLVVLAVLLLIPSPGTLVTAASMVWIVIGLVLWIRAIPSPSRRRYREARRSHAEHRARTALPEQHRSRGRRGDNPHR